LGRVTCETNDLRVDFFNSNESRDPIDFKKSCNFNDAERNPLDTQECRRGSNMSCGAIDSREIQLASGRCGNFSVKLNFLKFNILIIPCKMKF